MAKRVSEVRFTVSGLMTPTRLDKVLRAQFPRWGRQAVGKVISSRQVKINHKRVWLASWKVSNGDQVIVENAPKDKQKGPEKFDRRWIISEEQDLIVINKPAGLRSQATRAGGSDNLLSLAQQHFGDVHLFHRLDRDTSGLCLLTRPGPINKYLDNAFKQHLVEKEYFAVVAQLGDLEGEGVITSSLVPGKKRRDKMRVVEKGERVKGMQSAETRYLVRGTIEQGYLVRLWPVTGRMHQLRVHLASHRAPVIGDRLYGGKKAVRLMLHAIRLVLPEDGEFPKREYSAPVDWVK